MLVSIVWSWKVQQFWRYELIVSAIGTRTSKAIPSSPSGKLPKLKINRHRNKKKKKKVLAQCRVQGLLNPWQAQGKRPVAPTPISPTLMTFYWLNQIRCLLLERNQVVAMFDTYTTVLTHSWSSTDVTLIFFWHGKQLQTPGLTNFRSHSPQWPLTKSSDCPGTILFIPAVHVF